MEIVVSIFILFLKIYFTILEFCANRRLKFSNTFQGYISWIRRYGLIKGRFPEVKVFVFNKWNAFFFEVERLEVRYVYTIVSIYELQEGIVMIQIKL